ncbi:MAG: glycerol-3-phosphate acyltransferase [Bacteroidetes bacterium]|nr:glycerol-3-phosphate acyltransferase [Bacteroidota bacterium]
MVESSNLVKIEHYLYFVLCYLFGCIIFGLILTKFFYHGDIRLQGSGNIGARNVGRVYGKSAFVITFIGDALKGIAPIVVARLLNYSESIQLAGLAFATLGHIKPVTLKYKGGKGLATFSGGIIIFNPIVVPFFILSFGVLYAFIKNFNIAGLISLIIIPAVLYYKQNNLLSCIIVFGIIILIFLAHLKNIKDWVKLND